jgi:hypothetical protein
MLRWLCALVTGGVLTGFTFLLLTGEYIKEGPVVASVTPSHGLHAGDIFVLSGWAAGIVALFLLARARTRSRSS